MATADVSIPLYARSKQRLPLRRPNPVFKPPGRASFCPPGGCVQDQDQFLTAKTSERLLRLLESASIPQAALALESTTSAYEVGKV